MIPAFIMAGGKGSRMGLPTEKPLLPFLGKPLIDWVADAILTAKKVSEFYVITSANTPQTEKYCIAKGWRVLRTAAKGYHNDLKQAVLKANLMGSVLTLSSDVPAITGPFLDKVISVFEVSKKDFLAVFVPIKRRQDLGLPISSTDEYKSVWYSVSGVNIINGAEVLSGDKIETSAIITDETEVLLNVNTTQDLEIAQEIMQKLKK